MAQRKIRKSSGSVKKTVRAPRKMAAPVKIAFDDEEGVKKEVCKLLDLDPSDVNMKSTSAPNGYGSAYRIDLGGHKEYYVMENDDEFETAARNGVEDDLRENPEIFNQDFIQGHIDLERLRDALMSDITDMVYDDLLRDATANPLEFMRGQRLVVPEPSDQLVRAYAEGEEDEDNPIDEIIEKVRAEDSEAQWETIGEEPEVDDNDVMSAAEEEAKSRFRNPLDYLEEIYGAEDAAAQAIKIAGIDISAAAEEAVSTDGAAHFMATYDGNYQESSPSGFIVWRHN